MVVHFPRQWAEQEGWTYSSDVWSNMLSTVFDTVDNFYFSIRGRQFVDNGVKQYSIFTREVKCFGILSYEWENYFGGEQANLSLILKLYCNAN